MPQVHRRRVQYTQDVTRTIFCCQYRPTDSMQTASTLVRFHCSAVLIPSSTSAGHGAGNHGEGTWV